MGSVGNNNSYRVTSSQSEWEECYRFVKSQ